MLKWRWKEDHCYRDFSHFAVAVDTSFSPHYQAEKMGGTVFDRAQLWMNFSSKGSLCRRAWEFFFTPKFMESILREASQNSKREATLAATSRTRPGKRSMAKLSQSNRGLRTRRPEQPHQDSQGGVGSRRGRPASRILWMRGGQTHVLTMK